MAFNKDTPYNELPNLPPNGFTESIDILKHLAKAARNLGELNGLCASLPDPNLLINTIVLQESKDSSAIENIVTTQDELYKATTEENISNHSAKEVLSYREALYVGLSRIKEQQNLLLTNTMVEVAQTIKQNNSGIRSRPGTALKNAINGSVVYTPPCCEVVIREKLAALESFINDSSISSLDPLIKNGTNSLSIRGYPPFCRW